MRKQNTGRFIAFYLLSPWQNLKVYFYNGVCTVLASSPFPAGHIAYIGPIAHIYSSRVLDGLQRSAFFQNYAVSFFCPGENLLDYLDKIAHSRFDGVLASTIGKIPSSFPLPVVYLDDAFPVEAPIRSSVSCSNYLGAEKMAKLAISRGHREIVICTEASSSVSRLERVRGFSDILQKADIPHVNEKIFTVQSRVTASCIRTLKNSAMRQKSSLADDYFNR